MTTPPGFVFLSVIALGVATSCVNDSGTPRGILRGGGESTVRITFVRSGGAVAAPGMTIEASIAIEGGGAHLTVTGDEYQRQLTEVETAQLTRNLDVARFFQLPADLRAHSPASADQYQYDITLEAPGGKHHSITLGGNQTPEELDAIAPGLGALFESVRREAEAIWQARISRR